MTTQQDQEREPITGDMIATWKINYGLDKMSPADAMKWWDDKYKGMAPAGAVAALGLLLQERESLTQQAEPVRVPEGFALVPVEPTPFMKTAGINVEVFTDYPNAGPLNWSEVRTIYAAMLAAAPSAQPEPQRVGLSEDQT